jgi:hypothetical protein
MCSVACGFTVNLVLISMVTLALCYVFTLYCLVKNACYIYVCVCVCEYFVVIALPGLCGGPRMLQNWYQS